jgi:hypothetical protein
VTGGGRLLADSKRIGCTVVATAMRANRAPGVKRDCPHVHPASGHEKGRPKAACDLCDSLTRALDQKK